MSVPDNLNHKQEKAIVALLNEHNISKAAAVAEVHEKTLYRWLNEKRFADAYRRARREAFGQAIALTQRYAPLAVNTLAKILMDDNARSVAVLCGVIYGHCTCTEKGASCLR